MKKIYTCIAIFLLSAPAFAATSVPFTIAMNEAVNVTGSPRIAIDVGGVTRYATYASGTGTSSLTFTYAAQAGDVDLDGVTLSSPIDLNGGTITDLNGNPETNLTFTVPDTSGIKINYPSLSMDFVADADGRYTLNGTAYNDLPSFLTATGGTFTRNSIGTYFDENGVMQTASANQPRFDHDPVTHTAKGILIEESRKNTIINGDLQGFTIGLGSSQTSNSVYVDGGTYGTLSANGTVIGTGVESGIPYIDVQISGSNTSGGTMFFDINGYDAIPVVNGEKYTLSFWYKRISGSGGTPYAYMHARDSSLAFLSQPSIDLTAYDNSTWKRVSFTYTITDPSVAYIQQRGFYLRHLNGESVNTVFRIGGLQVEKGAFPTSYIPTTTAAVTRAADNLIIPSGSWFNTTKGAIISKFNTNDTLSASNPNAISLESGTNNRIQLRRNNTQANPYFRYNADGISSDIIPANGSWSDGTLFKNMGMTYDSTTQSASVDGGSVLTNTHVSVPTVTNLILGAGSGGNRLNGAIQKLKYYPTRIPDTQLQLLTQ